MATKTMTKKKTVTEPVIESNVNNGNEPKASLSLETSEVTKSVKETKKEFKATDPIECVSITAGELGMIGIKSGINYTWAGRGDVTEVEYQDLVAAIRSSKSHIYKPYFIIQDEDFLKEFPRVKDVYSNMYSYQDLVQIFQLTPSQMKSAIANLPEGARESVKHIASDLIVNGSLDSVKKIQMLDSIYDTKFMLMTELFNA